jgi:hypothetical protein
MYIAESKTQLVPFYGPRFPPLALRVRCLDVIVIDQNFEILPRLMLVSA